MTAETANDNGREFIATETNENMDKCGDFVWNIEQLSDEKRFMTKWFPKAHYSDPFYSHEKGYKMRLRVDFIGYYDRINIYWCLMRGPFDNDLQWPFKPSVTIEIVNQQNMLAYKSKTIKISDYPNYGVYRKPVLETSCPIIFLGVYGTQLLKMVARHNTDQLSIRCSVKITRRPSIWNLFNLRQ